MVLYVLYSTVTLAVISCVLSAAVPEGLIATYKEDGGRIMGGSAISIDEVPYMAQLVYYGAQYCGASIISNKAVITAAHCIAGLTDRMTKIRVGTNHRNSGTLLPIRKMVAHQDFVSVTEGNDVALIWLQAPITFSELIQKIPMAKPGTELVPGTMALVSGWGYMLLNGYMTDQLQGVQVPIVSRDECNVDFEGIINDGMICAGYPEGKQDACSGDSGGPLVIGSQLVGLVSFGYLCGQPNYPGVYTNLAHFNSWVTDKLLADASSDS